MTRPTALYVRVSTSAQAGDERFGLDVQRRAAEQYAQLHGLRIVQTYQDVITGTRAKREALDQLLDQSAGYEVVLISSVDRLARRTGVAYAVLEELIDTGSELHSADMGRIDPKDEMSALNFGVRSVFAQSDHMRIVKRLRAGMLAKVQSGRPVVPPSAYGWHAGQHLEAEAHWVRQMYRWAREGMAATAITKELNRLGVPRRGGVRWREATVKYTLRNPLYKGQYTFGRARVGRGDGSQQVTCEVEAIIEPEVWEATQRAIDSRKKGGRPTVRLDLREFPLAKRMTCGVCGSTMSAHTEWPREDGPRKTPYRYYYCYRINLRDGSWAEPCTHRRYYHAGQLHILLKETLTHLALNPEALMRAAQIPPPAPVDHSPVLAGIDRRLERAKEAYISGIWTLAEYGEEKARLEAQRRALEAQAQAPEAVAPDLARLGLQVTEALKAEDLTETVRMLGVRAVMQADEQLVITIDPL